MNYGENHSTQLSTADRDGHRLWVYPSDVSGRFRMRRNWVHGVLLLVFLFLPWIRINGHQALLLDFLHGRFSVFGLGFWSHDAPLLLFVAIGAAVLLALVTAVWGRLWCGWACPQTVFVDSVFRRIERWVEGDAVRRRKLDAAEWSAEKFLKKSLKWFLYLLVSLILSHSFLAIFVGTEALAKMTTHSPFASPGMFTAMAGMTLAVLFDFGWFREQFCTVVCPYGRFQSVLMDEKSLAVAYNGPRGEPRRGTQKGAPVGDCVDCYRCVQVCPTGIDIRDGLQLECIACTACIDACDTVMTRLGKPPGLIAYTSGWMRGDRTMVRPTVYLAVLLLIAGGLIWSVQRRELVEMTLIRAIESPYQEVVRTGQEKEIVNHFKLELLNQSFDSVRVDLDDETRSGTLGIQVVSASFPADLKPGESKRVDVFVRFNLSKLNEGRGRASVGTVASSSAWSKPITRLQEVPLVGPLL